MLPQACFFLSEPGLKKKKKVEIYAVSSKRKTERKKVYISQSGEKRLKRGQEGRKRNVNSEGVKQVIDPGKKERKVAVWPSQ